VSADLDRLRELAAQALDYDEFQGLDEVIAKIVAVAERLDARPGIGYVWCPYCREWYPPTSTHALLTGGNP
jgi:hypothetical protein